MTAPSLISVVEQAYQLDGSDEAWLDGLVACVTPLLDHGLGTFGYLWDARRAPVKLTYVSSSRPEIVRMSQGINALAPPEVLRATYLRRTGLDAASQATGLGQAILEDPGWRKYGHPLGLFDFLAVNIVAGPGGTGCTFGAGLPRIESPRGPERRIWDRLAAHVGAGLRLRRGLAGGRPSLDDAEAVVSPSGRIEHAAGAARTPGARQRLREAAIAIDRARGKLRRRDPQAALELWQGLVAGRWSLLDHFERGGRRYLVARKNDPELPDPRALSARERQVAWCSALGHANKLIAYELGLSSSSVATYLDRAVRKLGLGSRLELIALVRALDLTSAKPGRC